MSFDQKTSQSDILKELGLFAFKSLLSLNAGAIIVLLTFVGNVVSSETVTFDISVLKRSMGMFSIGLAFNKMRLAFLPTLTLPNSFSLSIVNLDSLFFPISITTLKAKLISYGR
jgi:hypothetical protein